MKKLLYTTTAFVLCGGIVQANAACIATPSCTAMGYTSSSSCTNGIKCPFGNYWNCDLANKIAELEKKIDQQEQDNALKSCAVGHIFYSDMSCSSGLDSSKTPIGVVVYTDGNGHGQVIALKSLDTKYTWGSESNLSALPNYSEAASAANDYGSCDNSYLIMSVGDSRKYPAAWAAHEYSTEGTEAGDWCLPAAGIFTSIYNNMTTVNVGLLKAGGTQFTTSTEAWSSSESNSTYDGYTDRESAWYSSLASSYGLYNNKKYSSYEVRPVLEF